MQSKLRIPLARAVLCFALSAGSTPVALAATAAGNLTGLLALGASPSTNGSSVRGDVLLGADGNFYLAPSGGTTNNLGGLVRITPAGAATLVKTLNGSPEGAVPYAGVIEGPAGTYYGTSFYGGEFNLGAVFRIGSDGSYTTLHSFTNASQGGFFPYAGLVLVGTDLYGTTLRGGPSDAGTVFKVSTGGGAGSTIATFDGNNGRNPEGALALGPDGNLYGTTLIGGAADRGTVFRITPSGTLTTLHSFPALGTFVNGVATNAGGANPRAALTLAADGNFYGTAYQGGRAGYGVVFRMTPTGTMSVVHDFAGSPSEGGFPLSAVALLADGSLAGTTERGGASGAGTVWRIANGGYQTLHSFSALASDGARPYAGVRELGGALYGVTFTDGIYSNVGGGVFYRVTLPGTSGLPVQLSSSPDRVTVGQNTTFTWNAPTMKDCTFGDVLSTREAVANVGSRTVTSGAGTFNYMLSCFSASDVAFSASVPLVVTTPDLAPVDGGGDGGGGAMPLSGLALLGGALGFAVRRRFFLKDAA